nr:uroporphyrinogen decarboxylase family protein [Candidatus Sigynarchaeota archaeon]
MNVYERLFAALDVAHGRVPDKVPNHFVSLRPGFAKNVENSIELKDEDIVFESGFDLTIAKAIGAESLKCGPSLTGYTSIPFPTDYFDGKNIPASDRGSYHVGIYGEITKQDTRATDEFDSWYMDGCITDEAKFEAWKPYMLAPRPPKADVLRAFDSFATMAITKGICPVPTHGGPFTAVLEGMGWPAFAKYSRKNPGFIERFADIVTTTSEAYLKAVAHGTCIKIFHIPDDIAMKQNVMLTPKMMETVFFPFYQRYAEAVHREHGKIFLHTDGFVEPLIKYLVDAGFDGLQCLESAAGVDIIRVKKEWGDKLCLIGNVDCNRDLFFLSPAEMRAKARAMVESLKGGGGYIFGPSSTLYSGHPLPVVKAMVDGWKDARDY